MALVTASSEWGRIAFGAAAAYRVGGERHPVDAPPASDALSGSQPRLADIEGGRTGQDGPSATARSC